MGTALDEQSIAALADALAARLPRQASSPWLTVPEAAAYLRCPESRVRKLVMVRAIPHHREGRRVLFNVGELDEFIRNGGAYAA